MSKFLSFFLMLIMVSFPVAAKNKFDGPYAGVGVALGVGHIDSSQNTRENSTGANLSSSDSNLSPVGVLGGIHLGWNKAVSHKYVIGLEIWGDASSLDEKLKENNGVGADMSSKVQMDWSIGVAAKAGVVMGDGLAYLSLGWVGSEWKTKTTVTGFPAPGAGTPTTQSFSNKKFLSGFRPAVGYTWPVSDRLHVSAEGAYTFYGSHKTSNPFNFAGTNTTVQTKNRPQVGELRVKFSWKVFK